MSKTINDARALIQKRLVRGDHQAAADWVAKKYGMNFNRVTTREFVLYGGSRHHAHFFIEAYNAVQRNRQKRQSKKRHEHEQHNTSAAAPGN